jgi:hypothetical protein
VVIVTFGATDLYPVAHAPNSGNISVLPVSVSAAADEAADEDVAFGEDDEEELLELPQAAASTVSGTMAAAVQTRRILLATGTYSFVFPVRFSAQNPVRARARAMS